LLGLLFGLICILITATVSTKIVYEKAQKRAYKNTAVFSHEIRNRLNLIVGYTTLMLESETQEASSSFFLKEILKSGKNIERQILEVLDHARVEADKISVKCSSFCLPDFLDDLKIVSNFLDKSPNFVFSISNYCPHLQYLISDKQKIEQVLVNLLTNAFKFTKTGSVDLSVSNDDEWVYFSVSDTGSGIPEHLQPLLFNSFFQTSFGSQKGGTGLGLWLSKHIAEALGGSIVLESKSGYGSVFTLKIPNTQAQQAEKPLSQNQFSPIDFGVFRVKTDESEKVFVMHTPDDLKTVLNSDSFIEG